MSKKKNTHEILFLFIFVIHTLFMLLILLDSSFCFLPGKIEIKLDRIMPNFETFYLMSKLWILLLSVFWILFLFISMRMKTHIDLTENEQAKSLYEDKTKPVAFFKDKFYTFHQFLWLPILILFLIIVKNFDSYLGQGIQSGAIVRAADGKNLNSILDFLAALNYVCLGIALGAFFLAIGHQINIQKNRSKGEDKGGIKKEQESDSTSYLYWWDFRINKFVSVSRIFLVGVDYFMGAFILLKIFSFIISIFFLGDWGLLKFQSNDPRQLGGFFPLAEIAVFANLTFAVVILFGILSSVYHKDHPSYKLSDTLVTLILPVVFMFSTFIIPLQPIHRIMSQEKWSQLENNQTFLNMTDMKIASEMKKQERNDPAIADLISQGTYLRNRNDQLKKLQTWPFNVEIISTILLSILFPLALGLIGIYKPRIFRDSERRDIDETD